MRIGHLWPALKGRLAYLEALAEVARQYRTMLPIQPPDHFLMLERKERLFRERAARIRRALLVRG